MEYLPPSININETINLTMPFDLATAVTGFVSGIIGGIVTFEYRHIREQKQALRAWYEKVEQLSAQIIHSHKKCDNQSSNQVNSWKTCDDVGYRLRLHLSEAPSNISSDILEESFELVRLCSKVSGYNEGLISSGNANIQPAMQDAGEQARKVKNAAADARGDVGIDP